MKALRGIACISAVVFLGLGVASCGQEAGQPNPKQTSAPSSECAHFLPEAPCGRYASIAGSDNGQEIPWVTAGEVTAELSKRGADTHLSIVMPCGPLDAVVTIDGKIMRLTGQRALGASGCVEGQGERQDWILKLLERGVELGYNNTLTLTNGGDSLSFAHPGTMPASPR